MPDSTIALRILVYSDNVQTREQVMRALGKRLHPDLPELTYVEVATGPMVIRRWIEGGIDLAILDGEATPTGGMGIAKQLKDELDDVPADPGAHRPPRRCVAGQLVAGRSRGVASPSTPSCWAGPCSGCCAPPFAEPDPSLIAAMSAPPAVT